MFEEAQTVIENANKVVVNSVPMDLTGFHTLPEKLLNGPHNPGGLQNKKQAKGGTQMEPKDTIKTVSDLEVCLPGFGKARLETAPQKTSAAELKPLWTAPPRV